MNGVMCLLLYKNYVGKLDIFKVFEVPEAHACHTLLIKLKKMIY